MATGKKWPENASELKFSESECEDAIKLPLKDGDLHENDLDKVTGGIFACAPPKFNIGSPKNWQDQNDSSFNKY